MEIPSGHYYLTDPPTDSRESTGNPPVDSLESVGGYVGTIKPKTPLARHKVAGDKADGAAGWDSDSGGDAMAHRLAKRSGAAPAAPDAPSFVVILMIFSDFLKW